MITLPNFAYGPLAIYFTVFYFCGITLRQVNRDGGIYAGGDRFIAGVSPKTTLGRPRSHRRTNGGLQMSPVTVGLDSEGAPHQQPRDTAYKVNNLRRDPRAALCAFTNTFHGEGWVQVGGGAEVLSLPHALDTLVHLHRQAYGEHKNWPDFHARMIREKRVIIRITIESVGPKVRG